MKFPKNKQLRNNLLDKFEMFQILLINVKAKFYPLGLLKFHYRFSNNMSRSLNYEKRYENVSKILIFNFWVKTISVSRFRYRELKFYFQNLINFNNLYAIDVTYEGIQMFWILMFSVLLPVYHVLYPVFFILYPDSLFYVLYPVYYVLYLVFCILYPDSLFYVLYPVSW